MSPHQDPDELLRQLSDLWKQLLEAREPLSVTQQHEVAHLLADVFNHYSELVRQPGGANALMRASAFQHRTREAHASAQQQLEAHRAVVKSLYEGADQYLRAIQIGGFAALFAVWGFTREALDPKLTPIVGLLLTISATAFGLWEIAKATIVALAIGSHAQVAEGSLEHFLRKRASFVFRAQRLHANLPKARVVAWLLSVIPALIAFGLLITSFILSL